MDQQKPVSPYLRLQQFLAISDQSALAIAERCDVSRALHCGQLSRVEQVLLIDVIVRFAKSPERRLMVLAANSGT